MDRATYRSDSSHGSRRSNSAGAGVDCSYAPGAADAGGERTARRRSRKSSRRRKRMVTPPVSNEGKGLARQNRERREGTHTREGGPLCLLRIERERMVTSCFSRRKEKRGRKINRREVGVTLELS